MTKLFKLIYTKYILKHVNYYERGTRLIHTSNIRFIKENHEQKIESSKNTTANFRITQGMLLANLSNRENVSLDEWEQVRTDILKAGRSVNNTNIDANIIGACFPHKRFNLAKSYLLYLKHNKRSLNFATIGKLLRLYYVVHNETEISEDIENDIINLYDDLVSKSKILDATTAEHAIHALSLTRQWKECFKLLDMIKITNIPNASAYSVIAAAAFMHKDVDLGWKILNDMKDVNRVPLSSSYLAWLKFVESNKGINENLQRLFEYFAQNDVKPFASVVDKMINILKKNDLHCHLTIISKSGSCKTCKEILHPMKLSNEEYKQMKSNFYSNVMLGKNIYTKSNPKEMERFLRFVEKCGTYDMVIDGLNIAYSSGIRKSPQTFINLISAVVRHFVEKGQKVMVFGRAHMNKWPKQQMEYIINNSLLFLAEDLSEDDPFLLYAAMHSSPNTGFISRDLMRSHAYKMGDPYFYSLFRRWQHHNQHILCYVEKSGNVNIKYPLPFMPIAQRNNSFWHIPYENEDLKNSRLSFELPKHWLCVSMSKNVR